MGNLQSDFDMCLIIRQKGKGSVINYLPHAKERDEFQSKHLNFVSCQQKVGGMKPQNRLCFHQGLNETILTELSCRDKVIYLDLLIDLPINLYNLTQVRTKHLLGEDGNFLHKLNNPSIQAIHSGHIDIKVRDGNFMQQMSNFLVI